MPLIGKHIGKAVPRVLFDTSVLVSALIENHPRHRFAAGKLAQAHAGKIRLVICSHAVAELYSTLTALPGSPRLNPKQVHRLISENVLVLAEIVTLEAHDYQEVLEHVADLSLSSGVIYDALHVRAGQKAGVDRILTLNVGDFVGVWPDHGKVIRTV